MPSSQPTSGPDQSRSMCPTAWHASTRVRRARTQIARARSSIHATFDDAEEQRPEYELEEVQADPSTVLEYCILLVRAYMRSQPFPVRAMVVAPLREAGSVVRADHHQNACTGVSALHLIIQPPVVRGSHSYLTAHRLIGAHLIIQSLLPRSSAVLHTHRCFYAEDGSTGMAGLV